MSVLGQKIGEPIAAYLATLSPRDRKIVVLASAVLAVFLLGYALFSLHQKSLKTSRKLDESYHLLQYMSSQYPHLDMAGTNQQPLDALVQNQASAMGLAVSVNSEGQTLHIETRHQSFAVLANFLTGLAGQGVHADTLVIQQQTEGFLQLQATLSR